MPKPPAPKSPAKKAARPAAQARSQPVTLEAAAAAQLVPSAPTLPPSAVSALPGPTPATLSIPLTDQQLADCKDLYTKLQTAMEDNSDKLDLYDALSTSRKTVNDLLNLDSAYRLQANTDLYASFTAQIKQAHVSLNQLKQEILKIDSKLARFAELFAAISKIAAKLPVLLA